VIASTSGKPEVAVAAVPLEIAGGAEQLVQTEWAPPAPGVWTVRAVLEGPSGAPLTVRHTDLALDVAPAQGAGQLLGGRLLAGTALAPLLALCAGLALAAGLVSGMALAPRRRMSAGRATGSDA
jgi:hypothetical protein